MVDLINPGYIVLQNTGNGDVFIRKLHWTGTVAGTTDQIFSNGTIPINKALSKTEGIQTLELNRPEVKKKEFEGEYMRDHEVSKESRVQLWNKAVSPTDQCWDIRIQLTKTESMAETERAVKKEFWSVPLQGILYFTSLHTNESLEHKFDLLGFVVKNINGKC